MTRARRRARRSIRPRASSHASRSCCSASASSASCSRSCSSSARRRSTTTCFLSATNVQQLLSGAAIIALLAIGETIVIITRNVDLSIGSVLGISAYATGVLYVHHPHVPLVLVFLLALGIGAALRGRQRR